MTRRPLRLVPKRDNVVDLHEFRRKHPMAGRWYGKQGAMTFIDEASSWSTAGLADDPRRPALRSAKREGGDAWPLPCDCEPTGDDVA